MSAVSKSQQFLFHTVKSQTVRRNLFAVKFYSSGLTTLQPSSKHVSKQFQFSQNHLVLPTWRVYTNDQWDDECCCHFYTALQFWWETDQCEEKNPQRSILLSVSLPQHIHSQWPQHDSPNNTSFIIQSFWAKAVWKTLRGKALFSPWITWMPQTLLWPVNVKAWSLCCWIPDYTRCSKLHLK